MSFNKNQTTKWRFLDYLFVCLFLFLFVFFLIKLIAYVPRVRFRAETEKKKKKIYIYIFTGYSLNHLPWHVGKGLSQNPGGLLPGATHETDDEPFKR